MYKQLCRSHLNENQIFHQIIIILPGWNTRTEEKHRLSGFHPNHPTQRYLPSICLGFKPSFTSDLPICRFNFTFLYSITQTN